MGAPDIDIVDIGASNDTHCEMAIAALQAGKAVICEKPLGRDLAEARRMLAAARRSKAPSMVCHNYRRIPAVALARQLIEGGELGGAIRHFRARYAQEWGANPAVPMNWRLQKGLAGSGAHGDIDSHIIDLGRYLVGEFKEVCGLMETFIKERPLAGPGAGGKKGRVTVDDAVSWIGRFENGAVASLEATRYAMGRRNQLTFEINGDKGSLAFDLEDMNRLKVLQRRRRGATPGIHRHHCDGPRRRIPTWGIGGRRGTSSVTSTPLCIRSPISSRRWRRAGPLRRIFWTARGAWR